jgi:hypothetical protein
MTLPLGKVVGDRMPIPRFDLYDVVGWIVSRQLGSVQ